MKGDKYVTFTTDVFEQLEVKRPLGWLKQRWETVLKMNVKEIGNKGVE